MTKIVDVIKARKIKLSAEEVDGIRSRLIFAGLNDDMDATEVSLANRMLDKVLEKMRAAQEGMQQYPQQTTTIPRQPQYTSPQLMVSLINGRIATFDATKNIVMPLKVDTTNKK